jgi:hypothetical protein
MTATRSSVPVFDPSYVTELCNRSGFLPTLRICTHWLSAGSDLSKQECLSKLILFGEASLKRALAEYLSHDHGEPNYQGK